MYATVKEKSPLNDEVQIISRINNNETKVEIKKKRVAAYCRVSTDLETQESSLQLQMEAFRRVIDSHPDWQLAGIFADEGFTGTQSENRLEFQRMMESARQGLIDVILVKSVSRFARNTADSLRYTRELAEIGVGVYFEKEGIDTSCFGSEFLLTIFAAFAQEESHSISENIKTGLRNRFKLGEVPWYTVYGYRKGWIIEEREAEVVRLIFKLYADGNTMDYIVDKLNNEGIKTPRGGKKWTKCVIADMLRNERYIGDALMQKSYVENFVTHKRVNNRDAKIEQYYKANNHEPIIDKELFNKVQRIITMQSSNKGARMMPYYGILKCPYCGKAMIKVWIDGTIRQSAWTCGGEGPETELSKRTDCPTYILQERLMERTLKKAVLSLDKTVYPEYYKAIFEAQNELEVNDKLNYKALNNIVFSITLEGNEKLKVSWKMGLTEAYNLDYRKASEAIMPDMQLEKFTLRNKKAFIDGFKSRQKKILGYQIIDTEYGVPIVKKGDE